MDIKISFSRGEPRDRMVDPIEYHVNVDGAPLLARIELSVLQALNEGGHVVSPNTVAKLLEKRLEIVCKGLTFTGIAGTDGERVQKAIMQATPPLVLHPKPNCEDTYYAVIAPLLEIRTFV